MKKFYLDQHLNTINQDKKKTEDIKSLRAFERLCAAIYQTFSDEWDEDSNMASSLETQKKAIIGYENEVSYFKDKIKEYLRKNNIKTHWYPKYYTSIEDAVFHHNWGLAGIAEWFTDIYKDSSSAKIIGESIYFLEDSQMIQKPQTISKSRKEQLIRALLLVSPKERFDKDEHEVYMLDGTRITIFNNTITKQNQDVIIFRRYTVKQYTFEKQAEKGTIPKEAVELFKSMVKLGVNVAFTGAVRSAKTTFLATWQSYEDPKLEGVLIETDPEIPLHKIMPGAPIMQIVVDENKMLNISKHLMRSDADYFIFAEARDGLALDTALKIANKGSKRMKITFHCTNPIEFCYDVAAEIFKSCGGNMNNTIFKISKSFQYIFHFIQLNNKSQKRLKSIHELTYDPTNHNIVITEICKYNTTTDSWNWRYHLNQNIKKELQNENPKALQTFIKELKILNQTNPLEGDGVYIPRY